jgi:hypothetical protein
MSRPWTLKTGALLSRSRVKRSRAKSVLPLAVVPSGETSRRRVKGSYVGQRRSIALAENSELRICASRRSRDDPIHEPRGKLMGQCTDGKLLRPLNTELVHQTCYPNRDAAPYIEGYYNRQRLHSALGISPPNRQSAKSLNPVSTKSGEGQTMAIAFWRRLRFTGKISARQYWIASAGNPAQCLMRRNRSSSAAATISPSSTRNADAHRERR